MIRLAGSFWQAYGSDFQINERTGKANDKNCFD